MASFFGVHHSYKQPNSFHKGDGSPVIHPASAEDAARAVVTQTILMNIQHYAKALGHELNADDIDKTDPEFQEWVTALLKRQDEFPCTGDIPDWAPLPTDPLIGWPHK